MKTLDCRQGSDEWLELHRGRPTASSFHRIITPKQWKYASGADTYINELIAEKYTGVIGSDVLTTDMVNGIVREDDARRYYEFDREATVEQVGFCLTDDERFGCSPDGLVGEDGGVELKCPKMSTQVKWLRDGGVPAEHLAQCHGGLWVTGRKWWDFMSYCPPLPVLLVRVEPDEKTEQLGAALEKFWKEYQAAIAKIEKLSDAPLPTKTVVIAGAEMELSPYAESYF